MGKKDKKIVRYEEGGNSARLYAKYKSKYLSLRAQLGGGNGENDERSEPASISSVSVQNIVPFTVPITTTATTLTSPLLELPINDELNRWIHQDNVIIKQKTVKKIDDKEEIVDRDVKIEDGPIAYYPEIVKQYGNPTYFVNQPMGVAKWIKGYTERDISPHEYIMLKDEYVEHIKPKPHYDYVYSVIKVWIPPEKLVEVLQISGSINYDPLYKHLRARCHNFAANFATFRTVYDLLEGFPSEYAENIATKEENVDIDLEITKKLVSKYGESGEFAKELATPSYPLEQIVSSGILGLGTTIGL